MTTALTTSNGADIIERVVIVGDLKELKPTERVAYYRQVCESVGLNPLTKPFDYISLQGRLTLYARKDATDQLRRIHNVSVAIVARDRIEDVYVVTARASLNNGRTDESTGAVSIGALKGDALANALMKAETKAKRRVTLSICGLGWLDETELATIPDARPANVNTETGEIEDCSAERALLKHLRDDLKAAGGTPPPLTRAQVLAMSCEQIRAEIDETGARLDTIRAQQASEKPQSVRDEWDDIEASEQKA